MPIRDGSPLRRIDVIRFLEARGVGTRLLFAGNLIRQPWEEPLQSCHGLIDGHGLVGRRFQLFAPIQKRTVVHPLAIARALPIAGVFQLV